MSAAAFAPASDLIANNRHLWQLALSALCAPDHVIDAPGLARRMRALGTLLGNGAVPQGIGSGALLGEDAVPPQWVGGGTALPDVLPGAGAVPQGEEMNLASVRRWMRAADDTPEFLVQRWLSRQALALLDALRVSREAPGIAALPGLRRLCRQLHALLEIAQQTHWREPLRHQEIQLLAQHLQGQRGDAAIFQQCCGFFWALHYGLPHWHTSPLLPALSEFTGQVPVCMAPATRRMQAALMPEAAVQSPIAALVLQGYELAVAALQLRAMAAATLFGCLQALLIEHWFQALTLSSECRLRLRYCYGLTHLQPAALCEALYQLAALWPAARLSADLQVPLVGDGGSSAGSVRLTAIPTLLSRQLPTLNTARQAWFVQPGEFASHQLALQGELMMLERGAAAFKVRGIERLCGRLLELLMLLDLQGALARFPGTLLWRAHCHLLQLLDAAAAWWEATPDQGLLQELHDCSRQLLPAPVSATSVAEPAALRDEDAWIEVRRQLLGYVQSFSSLLEIQMRLDISGDGARWSAERLWRLQAALMPLLRYLLLEFSLALEQRRVLRLPTTGCLWLCLRHDAKGEPQAQLRDDSVHQAPGAVQWQQLQHRVLKHGGAGIQCAETSLGRCFTLTLPPLPKR